MMCGQMKTDFNVSEEKEKEDSPTPFMMKTSAFEEQLELQLDKDSAVLTSSSWSTVSSLSPATLGEEVDEKVLTESSEGLKNDRDLSFHHAAVDSTSSRETTEEPMGGCSTAIMTPTYCPVINGILCGSYNLEECEGIHLFSTAAAESMATKRHGDWRGHGSSINNNIHEDAVEHVAPLPLFFATRFRTMDAERFAERSALDPPPAGSLEAACQSTSDWYNMFHWLTLGSVSSNERSFYPISWNGHLTLGPDSPSNIWKARKTSRRRRQSTGQMISPRCAIRRRSHSFPSLDLPSVSKKDGDHSSSSQHSAQFTPLNPTMRQLIRTLPIVPINRPGQEDWEMIFLSNNESGAGSDESKVKKRTPSAAAPVPAGVSPSAKKEISKHKGSSSDMDIDTIAVRTPGADRSALKELPALRDAPPTKREELFILKLKLCSVIFSFDDPTADKRGKDMKRQTLLELVDYVNTPAGQKIFTESVMSDLMAMVSANVCRALPPATDDFDPEEDEPVLEPAWPHLQVAYEFFLRFIVSSEVNAKAAKKYVDQKFCLQLVELFDSEDPRERDYLKTILHRIYGKFMSHRSFIRRAISNVFYRFVYETERHNGIGELLEILGSIINGFAIPLKKEHLQFLVRALIPLHKPKCVALYHQQLSYCIIQYVEKDADTATPILNGFFKCWPWSSSAKQVMFLNELEEILELLGADQLAQVSTMLFTNLARCLDSDHFQVVERALFLWNNEHLVNSGCLSRLNAQTVLPIIYRPLYKNSAGHWNATVEGLAQNVLKMYMEYDLVLYDKCAKAYYREEEEAKRKLEALEVQWSAVEQSAAKNMPALLAK